MSEQSPEKDALSFEEFVKDDVAANLRRMRHVDRAMQRGADFRTAVTAAYGKREAERRGYIKPSEVPDA